MGIVLSNIIAIYRRELQSYFTSPLAYAIATIFWLLSGYFFVALLLGDQGILQQVATAELQAGQTGQPLQPIDVASEFLQWFLSVMSSLALFILPILSMGLYAEERKRGTLELLATSPITNWAVAVGKLLGVVTFFTVLVLPLVAAKIVLSVREEINIPNDNIAAANSINAKCPNKGTAGGTGGLAALKAIAS